MIDLFQDRRVFVNQKRKHFQKNGLPQIKYPLTLNKHNHDFNDDFMTRSEVNHTNYQPLSNILISKRICPATSTSKTLSSSGVGHKKTKLQRQNHTNLRKQSVKRIIVQNFNFKNPQEYSNKKQQICLMPLIQQQNNFNNFKEDNTTGIKKRNSTSLSYRMRLKEKQRLFMDNISAGTQSSQNQQTKNKIKYDDGMCTFMLPKANNNEDLVREILLSRKIWREVKPGELIPNLKWVFSKQRYNYKKMFSYTQKRLINHFQFNEQISTKDNLIRNLQIYCETKKIEMFSITPVTFIIDFDDEWCEYNLKQFLNFFNKNDPRKLNNLKKSNTYNNSINFLNKFHPYMAWQNPEIKKKVNILSKPVNNSCYYSQNSYLWLLKPTGLNRGRGIEIFDSFETLEKMLFSFLELLNRKKFIQAKQKEHEKKKEKKQYKQIKKSSPNVINDPQNNLTQPNKLIKQSELSNSSPDQATDSVVVRQNFKLNNCSFVIQKYVQRPFLIDGRKFDIRVWALLTHKMQLFFFKQGYIRTSTQTYNTQNIQNYYIHLTNNAIQKNSSNYGQFQNGNQLAFKQLINYMSEDKVAQIWSRIKQITHMAFSSVKKKINYYQRRNCFEIFGLDYFIDQDCKVWLIQVNENPCIECSSGLLSQLVPRMLNDAFKLTIDQIVERKKIEDNVYPVDGYQDGENMWQSLGQLIPNAEYSPMKKQKNIE